MDRAEEKLITIFSGDESQALVAQTLLDSQNVKYSVKNELIQGIEGLGAIGTGYNPIFGPIEIQVLEEDVDKTKELLKNFK